MGKTIGCMSIIANFNVQEFNKSSLCWETVDVVLQGNWAARTTPRQVNVVKNRKKNPITHVTLRSSSQQELKSDPCDYFRARIPNDIGW